jgi:hypothetical protein
MLGPLDPASAAVDAPKPPLPIIVRVLSGVAAVVVFLLGFVVSVGAIVAAPVGMWLVRRRAERLGRPASRIATLVGSVFASMALGLLLWSLIFAMVPRPTAAELQSAAAQAQQRPTVKLPDWYLKAFPQAARYDSTSRAMVQSPTFFRTVLIVSAVFAGGFFGTIGGTFGWCGTTLLILAWSSRRASSPALDL